MMSQFKTIRKNALDVLCGNRVVFHHVPKCGGTSVYRSLRLRYALSFSTFDIALIYRAVEKIHPEFDEEAVRDESVRIREIQLLCSMYNDVRCIAGHVPFSDAAFDEFRGQYRFITTLREPISLYISTFLWNVNASEDRWQIQGSAEEFLETPRARVFGEIYARFFSGLSMGSDESIGPMIARAKENLAKFSAVGLTEDMAGFGRRLRDVLGIRISIGHENKSRVTKFERERMITPEIRRRIEELSAPNIEIYEFAKANLVAR